MTGPDQEAALGQPSTIWCKTNFGEIWGPPPNQYLLHNPADKRPLAHFRFQLVLSRLAGLFFSTRSNQPSLRIRCRDEGGSERRAAENFKEQLHRAEREFTRRYERLSGKPRSGNVSDSGCATSYSHGSNHRETKVGDPHPGERHGKQCSSLASGFSPVWLRNKQRFEDEYLRARAGRFPGDSVLDT